MPGVRENGGQYPHAAIWAVMAFALLGEGEHAWELFSMLNPISHSDQPEKSELYKVEPYVMCADVYSVAPHTGRGGWTWYTGAAGWMYRLTVETLLGLRLEVDKLRMAPLMPKDWSSYKIHYRYRETFYHIEVVRTEEAPGLSGTETTDGPAEQVVRVTMDGADVDQGGVLRGVIPLVDDRRDHSVEVEWARRRVPDSRSLAP